jgi:dCMP deaminase
MPQPNRIVVGLTGLNGSGKGSVSRMLKERGFRTLSLSDILRTEARKRKIRATRSNLIALGNRLRKEQGHGVLAKLARRRLPKSADAVVDSIRNPGEVEELRKIPYFFLWAIDAPLNARFKRESRRGRRGRPTDLDAFKGIDDTESSELPHGQRIHRCMEMADLTIENDGDLLQLERAVDTALKASIRPSWDRYFLKIATLVAERSTCRRHHVGAVLVRDRRILTTGYNGAAAGTKDCLELGCLRNELGIPSGERHEICRAIHAEQNAIIQAGLHGVSTEGATLYCTHTPCILCAKMIANARIVRFVTCREYADKSFLPLFKEAKIEFDRIEPPDVDLTVVD